MITREEINEKMKLYGLSQNALAREAGFDPSQMSAWVTGKKAIRRTTEFFLRSYFQRKDAEMDMNYNNLFKTKHND